jgi:hypothetical protein
MFGAARDVGWKRGSDLPWKPIGHRDHVDERRLGDISVVGQHNTVVAPQTLRPLGVGTLRAVRNLANLVRRARRKPNRSDHRMVVTQSGVPPSPSSRIRRPKAAFLAMGARYQFDIPRRYFAA